MKTTKVLKVIGVGTILFFTFIVVLGVIQEENKKEVTLRVINGTYSFCFIKNGKQYYFEVLGWVEPNSTILRQYLSLLEWRDKMGSWRSLILFLAVRTNLEWKRHGSTIECRVGELYEECFSADIDCALRVDNDTLLIPYTPSSLWESYKKVNECYEDAAGGRLYFEVYDFLGLERGDVVKIGRIVLTPDPYFGDVIDMYINYPLPRFSIAIENVTYLGYDCDRYLFNITLRLKGVGMIVYYSFDEFGRKEFLSEKFVPLYTLTLYRCPSEEVWAVKEVNETHYLVAVPTATGHLFANRYHFGGGFEDVWEEPQHDYIGSYASSGRSIWLKIEVFNERIVNGTIFFVTPWGQVHKVSTEAGMHDV